MNILSLIKDIISPSLTLCVSQNVGRDWFLHSLSSSESFNTKMYLKQSKPHEFLPNLQTLKKQNNKSKKLSLTCFPCSKFPSTKLYNSRIFCTVTRGEVFNGGEESLHTSNVSLNPASFVFNITGNGNLTPFAAQA